MNHRLLQPATAATQLTDAAGAASLVIGLALVINPDRTSALLVLPTASRLARLIGCLDLGLAAGMLLARQRRSWMLARAALNAALAVQYRNPVPGRSPVLRHRAYQALSALTLIDGVTALALPKRR
jgi:hypothetical protein